MSHAFSNNAFSALAFDVGSAYDGFPISYKDPGLMAILGTTTFETLLYNYSDDEDYYVLVVVPDVTPNILYEVTPSFASKWFGLNAGTKLRVIYNPFLRAVW